MATKKSSQNILWFSEISRNDVALVGGKNASLGEMFSQLSQKGINIPDGFALTSNFYWQFIKENSLQKKLQAVFSEFYPQSLESLQKTGKICRELIRRGKISLPLQKEIIRFYQKLSAQDQEETTDVAVRTSGVAEDSPTTSFAGQFETFLNVRGKENLLSAVKESLISSFTDRAIIYREQNHIPQLKFALSIGVQKMVRSDLASSGIIFTLDTESGFNNVILINSVWGIGEMIVKGRVTPDEFHIFKPSLKEGYPAVIVKNLGSKNRKYVYDKKTGLKEVLVNPKERNQFSIKDEEVLTLARWASLIEEHYGIPMDIEWAKDGQSQKLFVVQARPETVQTQKTKTTFQEYHLEVSAKPLLEGIAVGNKIGQGKARVITSLTKINEFKDGEVLVAKMTDPDWLPAMRRAKGIVTDEGGRTCHSAIVARELGIPAIVGSRNATKLLKSGQEITVDCSTGQGRVFKGKVPFQLKTTDLKKLPETRTKVMVNIGAPEIAYQNSFLPCAGVGLARTEFILAEKIKIHPMALYHFARMKGAVKKKIEALTVSHKDKKQFFVDELAEGISQIAAAFWPKPVILRLSDLKTNEYRGLVGGELFEPQEQNPMIGLRGASRYNDKKFRPAFEMECRSIKKVREEFGLKNIWLMVPFCRTIGEGQKVLELMAKNGLGKSDELKVIAMCEIPANVILADEFLKIFDGFSIGSNDLTQLVLGIDRDAGFGKDIGDERNPAVKKMISEVIKAGKKQGKYIGICGDAPSAFPEFVEFLVREGIESISVSPEGLVKTIMEVSKIEKSLSHKNV